MSYSLVLLATFTSSAFADVTITFDQQSGSYSYSGQASAGVGDKVTLLVVNTDTTCFDFNGGAHTAAGAAAGDITRFSIPVTHQRGVSAYDMHIKKKAGAGAAAACAAPFLQLPERDWSAPIATLGWDIAFAGGFTVDGLVDRAYSLQPSTQSGAAGYSIIRDKDAEDKTSQRLALMIHLYNSSWETKSSLSWVPISFGVSVGNTTQYLAGTGVKFGDKFFVTFGATVGKRKDLPAGLHAGGFTTNQNALSTLPEVSRTSWLVAFSYAFLGTNVQSQLTSMFGKSATPAP